MSGQMDIPKTTMVYCPPCMKHWEAPARADYWNARVELCPMHENQKRTLFNSVEFALGRLGTLILFTLNILPRGTR